MIFAQIINQFLLNFFVSSLSISQFDLKMQTTCSNAHIFDRKKNLHILFSNKSTKSTLKIKKVDLMLIPHDSWSMKNRISFFKSPKFLVHFLNHFLKHQLKYLPTVSYSPEASKKSCCWCFHS